MKCMPAPPPSHKTVQTHQGSNGTYKYKVNNPYLKSKYPSKETETPFPVCTYWTYQRGFKCDGRWDRAHTAATAEPITLAYLAQNVKPPLLTKNPHLRTRQHHPNPKMPSQSNPPIPVNIQHFKNLLQGYDTIKKAYIISGLTQRFSLDRDLHGQFPQSHIQFVDRIYPWPWASMYFVQIRPWTCIQNSSSPPQWCSKNGYVLGLVFLVWPHFGDGMSYQLSHFQGLQFSSRLDPCSKVPYQTFTSYFGLFPHCFEAPIHHTKATSYLSRCLQISWHPFHFIQNNLEWSLSF